MPKPMVKAAISVLIAMGMSNIATAEMSNDVVESYQSYKTALLSLNQEKAEQSALAAWKAAEESLGDTKTTGDLAQNYADIAVVTKSNYRKIQRAYKRSIILASYYPEDEALTVRMDRTINLASMLRRNHLPARPMRTLIMSAIRDAESENVQAKTLLADLYTLQAMQLFAPGVRTGPMRRTAERAVTLYEAAQDGLYSPYRDIAEKIVSCKSCDPLIPPDVGAPKFFKDN